MTEEVPECTSDEHDWEYDMGSADSRQEWMEETDTCANCGVVRTHRTEWNQMGLVTYDGHIFY